jgi:IS30 family transposase
MARPIKAEKHLIEKYQELVWALSSQDYSSAAIGKIMNRSRSVIKRLIDKRPKDYKTKWVKVS